MSDLKVTDRRWWARGEDAAGRRRAEAEAVLRRGTRGAGSPRRTPSCSNCSASIAARRTSSNRRVRGCARNCRRTSSAAGARSSSASWKCWTTSTARSTPRPIAPDDPFVQGVAIVRQQFLTTLEGLGVKRIVADRSAVRPCAARSRRHRRGRRRHAARHDRRHRQARLSDRRRSPQAGPGGGRRIAT